jgi:ATP-dependent protease ClpP protease subunit
MKIAHVYIYGIIDNLQAKNGGDYGIVSLKTVKDQLEQQSGFEEIIVHIHSEGGDVTEGFAIHDFLKSQGKPITTIVEGMCASIATVPALAGDKRQMTANSTFFIHNPWGFIGGEKEDIQRYANELEEVENKLSDFYAQFSSLSKTDILKFMKVETAFTADEAVANGFMTEVLNTIKAVATLKKDNLKPNNMSYTKEELDAKFKKSETLLDKILARLKGKGRVVNLVLQDANGDDVDFVDLADGDTPKIGDKATLDGAPIPDGDYVFPSLNNITISFLNGEVAEVATPEEESQEMEALKTENQTLKDEIVALKAKNSTQAVDLKEATKAIVALNTEFADLKKTVGSSFNYKNDKNGNQGGGADGLNTEGRKRTPLQKKD